MTRRAILEIAPAHQLRVRVGTVTAREFVEADELFVTSTAGGVMPVTRLDGGEVGDGRPGRVTKAIRDAYWALHDDPRYATDCMSA